MSKRKEPTAEVTAANTRAKGFTDHHKLVKAAGATLVGDSRPKNQPYRFEEWLGADRRYKIAKVYDDGRIITYNEQAQVTDPSATAEALR